MKVAVAALASFTAGAWTATYLRRNFGALVTWAFARGDTPTRRRP